MLSFRIKKNTTMKKIFNIKMYCQLCHIANNFCFHAQKNCLHYSAVIRRH